MATLFISDLHLGDDLTQFAHFCTEVAPKHDEIFILGDLFNLYLGDDLLSEEYSEIVALLRTLSSQTSVHIMFGNRDFLMGKAFCQQTGCEIITDPYIYGDYVLMHGDSLVRDDWKYRLFKLLIRNPLSITLLKLLPKTQRKRLAHSIKQKAHASKHTKPLAIMDVNNDYCDKVMRKFQGKDLIHGHTHRPHIHVRAGYTRYVLPSWECTGDNQPGGLVLRGDTLTPVSF